MWCCAAHPLTTKEAVTQLVVTALAERLRIRPEVPGRTGPGTLLPTSSSTRRPPRLLQDSTRLAATSQALPCARPGSLEPPRTDEARRRDLTPNPDRLLPGESCGDTVHLTCLVRLRSFRPLLSCVNPNRTLGVPRRNAGDFDCSGDDSQRDWLVRTNCWTAADQVLPAREQDLTYELPGAEGKRDDPRWPAFAAGWLRSRSAALAQLLWCVHAE